METNTYNVDNFVVEVRKDESIVVVKVSHSSDIWMDATMFQNNHAWLRDNRTWSKPKFSWGSWQKTAEQVRIFQRLLDVLMVESEKHMMPVESDEE